MDILLKELHGNSYLKNISSPNFVSILSFFVSVIKLKILTSSNNSVSRLPPQFIIHLLLLYRDLFQIAFGQLDNLIGRKKKAKPSYM